MDPSWDMDPQRKFQPSGKGPETTDYALVQSGLQQELQNFALPKLRGPAVWGYTFPR